MVSDDEGTLIERVYRLNLATEIIKDEGGGLVGGVLDRSGVALEVVGGLGNTVSGVFNLGDAVEFVVGSTLGAALQVLGLEVGLGVGIDRAGQVAVGVAKACGGYS